MSADGTAPSTVQPTVRSASLARPSLRTSFLDELDRELADADAVLADRYPGDPGSRQPVHTVYVNADLADAQTLTRWAAGAREVLAVAAADPAAAAALGLPAVDEAVLGMVRAKLDAEPIEDLRLDFEDGYGNRPDDEEDADALRVAALLAVLLADPAGPLLAGIRFKSLEQPTRRRGLRTLDLVVSGVLAAGPLPDGFLVTLPKVTSVDQVTAMVKICQELERAHALPAGALRFEIQIETPQAILGADGTATVAGMIGAAGPRCVALHYGTFDYSAACGVAAAQQSLAHPVADHAKAVMQVAAAGTGVRLSDGSTNVMPVGSPDADPGGRRICTRGLVTRSLRAAYYQGWDMHPGHLVEPVPGDLRVLPGGSAGRGRPAAGVPEQAGRWGGRRTGHRAGAGRVPDARRCTAARSTTPRCSSRPASAGTRSMPWLAASRSPPDFPFETDPRRTSR